MKKLINQPDAVVREALEGMAMAHADLLQVSLDPPFIKRAGAPRPGKVALVSGGGSGHEPLHGGYVGRGMLDAACPGEIFTSPTPDQIVAAAQAVNGDAGVLFIVKNYSGDVMNFEMAAELLALEGIAVATVLIDDDVAVQDSLYTAGRRGVGATVLAEKIGGAAAEEGRSLEQVAEICRRVNAHSRSMGLALTSCVTPAAGRPTFFLGDDEIEMGIGIHGEPGRTRQPLAPVDTLIEQMATVIFADLPFAAGDQAIVMVNGMGGTPLIELYIVYRRVEQLCAERGISVVRRLVGNQITALEMQGCSLTVLQADDELLRLWDMPVFTPALRWGM
jgi:dihydroxyacetone kinase-like protein